MAKVEIDNKKMWESLRKAMWYFPEAAWLTRSIDTALSEQGLTVNDKGEITTIEPKVEWYMCIKESAGFKAGHIYKCNGGRFVNDLGVMFTAGYWGDYFRPATEEEIPQTNSTKPYNPLKHQGAANDHVESKPEPNKCLFTKDLYTDEERKELCEDCQEECELNKNIPMLKEVERNGKDELTDFEKVLAECIHHSQGNVISPEFIALQWSDALMAEARKQIASEIDATQMTREIRIKEFISLTLGAAYYQGIVNTIKKIKGENV